jgi:hypothetical protein
MVKLVLKKYPTLNYYGFVGSKYRLFKGIISNAQYEIDLKNRQEELFLHLDQIDHVVNWLCDIGKSDSINTKHTSYGLKHLAEKTALCGYISNGAFIVGAILAGFTIRKLHSRAKFNMSEGSLNSLLKEEKYHEIQDLDISK